MRTFTNTYTHSLALESGGEENKERMWYWGNTGQAEHALILSASWAELESQRRYRHRGNERVETRRAETDWRKGMWEYGEELKVYTYTHPWSNSKLKPSIPVNMQKHIQRTCAWAHTKRFTVRIYAKHGHTYCMQEHIRALQSIVQVDTKAHSRHLGTRKPFTTNICDKQLFPVWVTSTEDPSRLSMASGSANWSLKSGVAPGQCMLCVVEAMCVWARFRINYGWKGL